MLRLGRQKDRYFLSQIVYRKSEINSSTVFFHSLPFNLRGRVGDRVLLPPASYVPSLLREGQQDEMSLSLTLSTPISNCNL